MKVAHNRKSINVILVVNAFLLGVIFTLLIGAVTTERKMGLDVDRDEAQLNTVFNEALEKFQNEVGSEELTLTYNEIWDLVELGYWLGVNSHTVNMGQIVSYYDFVLRDPREVGNSRFAHMNKFISEQCDIQINRFSILMRKKFEANKPEFKTTFNALQKLLSYRADAHAKNVICPFDEAGLDLYGTESVGTEEE